MITAVLAANPPALPANWPGWLVIIGIVLLVLAGLGRWLKS